MGYQRGEEYSGSRDKRGSLSLICTLAFALGAYWCFSGCGESQEVSTATRGKSAQYTVDTAGKESPIVLPATADEILQAVHDSWGHVVLVNIWATWCAPCVEELPDILRLRREYGEEGLEVILVSGDFDTQLPEVKQFLADQGVDFPSYIKAQMDMDFINTMNPAWSGALPATFIFDDSGTPRDFWVGKASYTKFEQKVQEILHE